LKECDLPGYVIQTATCPLSYPIEAKDISQSKGRSYYEDDLIQ
jgi:hypothetical protein